MKRIKLLVLIIFLFLVSLTAYADQISDYYQYAVTYLENFFQTDVYSYLSAEYNDDNSLITYKFRLTADKVVDMVLYSSDHKLNMATAYLVLRDTDTQEVIGEKQVDYYFESGINTMVYSQSLYYFEDNSDYIRDYIYRMYYYDTQGHLRDYSVSSLYRYEDGATWVVEDLREVYNMFQTLTYKHSLTNQYVRDELGNSIGGFMEEMTFENNAETRTGKIYAGPNDWTFQAASLDIQYNLDGSVQVFDKDGNEITALASDVYVSAHDLALASINRQYSGEKIVKETFAQGMYMEYYYDYSILQWQILYNADGSWLESVNYYWDGNTPMYRWILDLDPANTGDVTYEEFNTYGNVAKRVYDNGGFMLADYDTETANKYSEQYYNASWGWEKSIVFWGDRDGTMRYQWIPDADPGNTGNEVFYEYDDQGRMIKKQYDDGAFTLSAYYTDSGNKGYDQFFTASWGWLKSIVYWDVEQSIMHYQWIPDADPNATGNDTFYEYDDAGRLKKVVKDNGDFNIITYLDGKKYSDEYYDGNWSWQKSIVFNQTNDSIMQYQWVNDYNPGTYGDVVFLEYDNQERVIKARFDTTDFIIRDYWGETYNRYADTYYGDGWSWYKTIVYYEDGTTMHEQYLADPDPNTAGDLVYIEYDTDENIILRRYDDGSEDDGSDNVMAAAAYVPADETASTLDQLLEATQAAAQQVDGDITFTAEMATTTPDTTLAAPAY